MFTYVRARFLLSLAAFKRADQLGHVLIDEFDTLTLEEAEVVADIIDGLLDNSLQ